MSLINEALKKAQADQARSQVETGPGGISTQQTAGLIVPGKGSSGGLVLGITAGILLTALVAGGIVWLVLRPGNSPATSSAPVASTSATTAPSTSASSPEPDPDMLIEPLRVPTFTDEAEPEPPTPSPQPQAVTPAETRPTTAPV
ncbi:MAG: hypothetical protein E1N59_3292, partial [Puniceicoccaceae bacterium 5H]